MSEGDGDGAAEEDVRVADERVLDGREDERVELEGRRNDSTDPSLVSILIIIERGKPFHHRISVNVTCVSRITYQSHRLVSEPTAYK